MYIIYMCMSGPSLLIESTDSMIHTYLYSAFVETTRVHYLCRDRPPEPIGSRNFREKNEQELVIYDPVGLPGSHSLFRGMERLFSGASIRLEAL